jgi:2-phosphoglycerate kinase
MERKIILIGGAPTVGKSYMARELSEKIKLPWISTDTIREQMRELVKKEDYPALFRHSDATADMAAEFLTHNSIEEIINHQNEESLEVWKGVKAIIETDYVWKSFIVEGVAILPELVYKNYKNNSSVRAVFIIDSDEQRIRETIFKRGLWDDADKYPDSVKEKEVEWVMAFNNYLKEEIKKYPFPIIEIKNHESIIDEIIKRL